MKKSCWFWFAWATLLILMPAAGAAGGDLLLPEHQPAGLTRGIAAGDTLSLLPCTGHSRPSFEAESWRVAAGPVVALDAQSGFYQLRGLDDTDISFWVYRSELAVEETASREAADPVPGAGSSAWLVGSPDLPVAGDTLRIAGAIIYSGPGLNADHRLLRGEQALVVLSGEDDSGMIGVRSPEGESGWIHRGMLDESRRRRQ